MFLRIFSFCFVTEFATVRPSGLRGAMGETGSTFVLDELEHQANQDNKETGFCLFV